MATKAITVRVLIEQVDDTGNTPAKRFDQTYTLSGFTAQTLERIPLGAAADDQAALHSAPALILVASHDNPFGLRLADGDTLLEDCMLFLAVASQTTTAMGQLCATPSVLLTGNGDNVADVERVVVKSP